MVGTRISFHMKADRPQSGVNPEIGWNGDRADVTRIEGNFRVPVEKSGPDEELPPEAAKGLRKKCLTSLFQRQFQLRPAENPGAVDVVIQVSVSVPRRDLVRIFLKKELAAHSEAAAAVVRIEARGTDG